MTHFISTTPEASHVKWCNSSSAQKQSLTRRQVQFVEYFEFFSEVAMVHPTWKEKKKVKKKAL